MNAMKAFDMSRPNIAAHATGSPGLRMNTRFNTQTSGKHSESLHQHQAIQFMLADMKTNIEAARMLAQINC